MAVCPGKVLVISSCRGYDNNVGHNTYRNPFNVYLNDIYIGDLIAGSGDKGEGFIGTLDGGVSIPPTHPLCDGNVGDFALSDTYRFDDSIINIGSNIIGLRADPNGPVYNSGAGGYFTFILYELSGTSLVNPITIHQSVGWAAGGGGEQQVTFQFTCPDSPPPIFTTTPPNPTTTGTPPQSAIICCECIVTTPKPSVINSLVFTPPGVILGDLWFLSTTTAPDDTILTYNIDTTTITTTTYIPSTTIKPVIPITPIPKKCKCKEKNCNYLGF
jgi:hypothetical protein